MTYMRMPLTVWGLWLTAILNVLFVPVLGSAALLLLCSTASFGTQFFVAGAAAVRGGGDPILFQHLFWIFGHPEVYILILPAWGIVGDIVSFFARKPAYWYKGSVYAMIAVTVLSARRLRPPHVHDRHEPAARAVASCCSRSIISVPAEVLFLNWLHTIWKGSIRLTVPDALRAGHGVRVRPRRPHRPLPRHDLDRPLPARHDVRGRPLPPDDGGRRVPRRASRRSTSGSRRCSAATMNEPLGKAHFWRSVIFITLVFCGQLIVGYCGPAAPPLRPVPVHVPPAPARR